MAVLRFGVGYDTVDVAACTEAGVALFITSGAVNYSVAEAILGWMLALGHHCFQKDRLTREGKWPEKNRWMGSELRRKTIGLIGLGGIGGALTELLKPFQTTELLAFDPYVAPERAAALNTRLTDLKELLRASDYVIVTCPLNEQTRGLLGAGELALMKTQAYLVNAARGGIVDESALEAALKSRQIAGAAVDVFATEPVLQHPFFALDNILLAPHAIAWTHELFQEISLMCCQQAMALSKGSIPSGLINHEVRERPKFLEKLRGSHG
jgi:phosphoglycerate dehydrogenase-like enzyme